ncbi:MAG: MBL fold metallo-hydrolase [Chloroflexi bacterium]|nr:MBL fold metallo-hydrolase [Chloroflexota bacterium]
MELRTRQVGPWGLNAYALACPETQQSVLIDPGDEPDTLQDMLAGTVPTAILLTHSHLDHVGALDEMRARLEVPVMMHAGPHAGNIQLEADRWLAHGDSVQVGNHTLRIYDTPGHTADAICIAIAGDERIIVGDAIFEGGPGKTWSPEAFQTTLRTLREIVLPWPDETTCYPGHGPAFRLGDKRRAIEAFLAKNHGAFYGDATWEM